MPRRRRPGPRENRTDLPPVAAPRAPAQPTRLPTGRPYGERAESAAAQGAVPLPDNAAMMQGAGQPVTPVPPPSAGAESDILSEFINAAGAAPSPGEGLLTGGSGRPDEPVTAGIESGAGPGPDVLSSMPGAMGPDPSVVLWARRLPSLSLLAAQPGSSPEVRQFVRRLRAQLPVDVYEQMET